MAIYNPPKKNHVGDAMRLAGYNTAAIGGIVSATGAGAVVGVPLAAIGGIVGGIGEIINAGQTKKIEQYDKKYQNTLEGEKNLFTAKKSNDTNLMAGKSEGINQSISNINAYITPQGGGTGIVNQRLV